MKDASYAVDASARSEDADIWFALPPGFVALPLRELAAAGWQPDSTGGSFAGLGPALRLARLLLEAGTVHCCLGLHADDEGRGGPLLAFFTLAWRRTGWAPRSVLAARAAAGAERPEDIAMLDLPCGPASLVQTRLTAPLELGLGEPCELLQLTAYVPCPDGERIAIVSLATTAVAHVMHYRALLLDITRTVSFDNPLSAASDDVSGED
ncbi:hypothetical protein [Streptomyces sp. NPDC093970]|uniref:hypothetical protein n=1 Tax=Streptomyces sp. NPDC093970 TaxID=3155076 RepID=UPI00342777AC